MRALLASIYILIFFISNARCFIPDSQYFLRQLTKKDKKINTYKIQQIRTVYREDLEGGKAEIRESIYLKHPWKYARHSKLKDNYVITVYNGSRLIRIINGKWIDDKGVFKIPFIYGFYLSKDKEELSLFLSSQDIDLLYPTLARRDQLVTILLRSKDSSPNMLWIDREHFWPLALRFVSSKDSTAIKEKVYSNYKYIYTDLYFPMSIDEFLAGKLTEQIRISEVNVNPQISEDLFNFEYIKKKYGKYAENEITPSFELEILSED